MKYSRIIALSVVFAFLTSAIPEVSAFTDVTGATPHSKAINALEKRGVVEGYADGTFKEGNEINRAEFLKIVLESRDYGKIIDRKRSMNCFPDVSESTWFTEYVCTAKDEGIISGYPDGTFKPERTINFAEASKILSLAFGQSVEQYSPDWYEPYVRALEGSRAIPPSIERLDAKVTRGEMAEMLWRLTEGVTDEPSKAYMNVKYPEVKVNLSTNTPQRATSCADLLAFTEEANRPELGGAMMKRMDGAMPMMAPAAVGAERAVPQSADTAYSQTNVQVEGVDEGDIVKTDGSSIYIIRNQEIRIVDAKNPVALKNAATITIDDPAFSPQDLYIEGDRLIVIGASREGDDGPIRIMEQPAMGRMEAVWPGPWTGRSFTVVKIYDVANPASPELRRTVAAEGNTVATRRIGKRLYLVTNQGPRYYGGPIPLGKTLREEMYMVPVVKDSARGDAVEAAVPCKDVVILPHVPSPSYLIVSVVPLDTVTGEVERTAVLGSGENVYASLESMYIAATDWNYVWDIRAERGSHQKTRLYRFAFTEDGVSFQAQGTTPGRILNQFSMDEHKNHFRIATTSDPTWSPNGQQDVSKNGLYVLNRDMEIVGSIEDIAPGERIYSTRFLGDRAYMVTFRTIDPLFVIDTSDPGNPTILGQLKIPGYSDYLHPYDENHIFGFGKEAVVSKDGTFAWQQGMKVALFDVTDVEHPVEMHRMTIGDRGTDSPLLSNHKALLFEKASGLLAFPVRVHKITNPQNYGDPSSAYGDPVFQGAHVYNLNLRDGFVLRGAITHYTDTDMRKAGGYFYGKDIERIIRIGDSLFTISTWGVKSHSAEEAEERGSVAFVDPSPDNNATCPDESQAGVKYVSKDPEQCALVRFSCVEGTEAFSNSCGCGCKPME